MDDRLAKDENAKDITVCKKYPLSVGHFIDQEGKRMGRQGGKGTLFSSLGSQVVWQRDAVLSCSTFNLLPLGRAFRPTPQELGLIRLCNLDVFQLNIPTTLWWLGNWLIIL